MPTIDQYAKSARSRVLLQGPPGTGKTTTACQWPKVWVMDCDLNLDGALRWLKTKGLPLPVGYDTIDVDDTGKKVMENCRFERLCKAIDVAVTNPAVETIVLDGMSKINDYIKDFVLKKNPTKSGGFEQTSWGFFYAEWIRLVGFITTSGKHSVLVAHEKIDKDELDGSTKFFLNTQGQFKDMCGSMFKDVWRCEVKAVGTPPVAEYWIKTLQSYSNHGLKNGLALPAMFKFDWKTIEEKLKS